MNHSPKNIRKSGIICTIGPGTQSPEMITLLRQAGMNIARLNFSHGTHEFHEKSVRAIRQSHIDFLDGHTAIALDTKGPEIRTGLLRPGLDFISIQASDLICITTDRSREESCDETAIYVDYPDLINSVRETRTLYIADGVLCLDVVEFLPDGKSIICQARSDYQLTSRKGVNLPGAIVTLPSLSDKDKQDLKFACDHDLDIIFASFIRKPSDINEIRSLLQSYNKDCIKIIAKIESQEGLDNFDDILSVADGIMVARGDLGIEIPPEKVFLAQKMIISKCNLAGKPVICATQMLESMIQQPSPTRAEVSDVANAILDGADCVMLSGETASGKYPKEAVQMMHKVVQQAESVIPYLTVFEQIRQVDTKTSGCITKTIASSAANAALDPHIQAIIVLTKTGKTPGEIARYRPKVPIIIVTRDCRVARQVQLHRGCYSLLYRTEVNANVNWQQDVDERIEWAIAEGKKHDLLSSGRFAIVIQGWKGGAGNTNSLRIISIP